MTLNNLFGAEWFGWFVIVFIAISIIKNALQILNFIGEIMIAFGK